jgi:hypothetical protein
VKRLVCVSVLSLWAWAGSAHAEVYIYPRRPSQTNVRYADFDWKYIDIGTRKDKQHELSFGEGAARLHAEGFRPPADGTWAWPSLEDSPLSRDASGETRSQLTPLAADQSQASGSSAAQPLAAGAPGDSRALGQMVPGATPVPLEGSPTAPREGAGHAGGVRLYFYERERPIAERAAASIEDSYRYLAREFGYRPGKTFAYFLYASYIEFLQTELFPLQEGVLGVTSPETLDVTLPYFGDSRLFHDVSTHELAHEFTIQKVAHYAARADVVGDPLSAVPLWFIEGLAEYYAKRGMDPEAEMLVRDILLNPKTDGYVLGSFWEDRFTSGLWTYKVGQARCAFLEETYGKGTIQRILQETPRLYLYEEDGGVSDFSKLVSRVTGASASSIAARFERWIKKRAFQTFLDARHDRGHFTTVHNTQGIVQAMRAAPSGELVMYRAIDPDTGQSKLYLFDRRAPSDDVLVVEDDEPGYESLHPVAGQNFTLTDHELAFVAQVGGADRIYYQRFVEAAEPELCEDQKPPKICSYDVDIDLGERRALELRSRGIDAVESIALAPDGQQIAFVGLSERGHRDIYLITLRDDGYEIEQLTDDVYSEREVYWGPNGIVFSSDATGHGKYNLFAIDPAGPSPRPIARLTSEPRDQLNPTVLSDGTVMFVAYDERGANLFSVTPDGVRKETDVATGLFDVSPGPDNSIWALHHHGAERSPVRVSRKRFLGETIGTLADAQPPEPPRARSVDEAKPYDVTGLSNWSLGSIFLMAGISGDGSVIGQISATAHDRLRDHGLVFSIATYGELALTDAGLTYVNEQERLIWGAGLFNDLRSRIDRTFEQSNDVLFSSWERYFGVQGLLRYPFSRFSYLQGSLSFGGSDYFLLDETAVLLADPGGDQPNLLTPWLDQFSGLQFQSEVSLAFGYTSIGMHRATGPIRGSSVLLSTNLGVQPFNEVIYDQVRLDAEHYFQIIGPVNLMVRGAIGTTVGSERAPQYYLSSFHTLRGVPFGDIEYLLGRNFLYGTVELQFPLLTLSSFPLIDLEGVLAADAGAVSDDYTFGGRRRPVDALWEKRVLDLVFGVNLGFGPIVIAIHFGQPIDLGDVPVPNGGDLVFNLALNWRYQ